MYEKKAETALCVDRTGVPGGCETLGFGSCLGKEGWREVRMVRGSRSGREFGGERDNR